MEPFERLLSEHPFLQGMRPETIQVLVGCATNVRFETGDYVVREGAEAKQWFLVRSGQVMLETRLQGRGCVQVGTLGENDVIGWSWLVPPYVHQFDARAIEAVRAVALDGVCLRHKCEADHDLGFEIMKRFLYVVQRRLVWARLQLVDMYGKSQ